jgi:hypothetical protein
MGNNTWSNLLDPSPVARGAAKNTFTTFADISPTPLPVTYANELKVGTKINVEAWGEYSSLTAATLQLGVWYGVVTAAWTMAAFTLGTTPAAWWWHLKANFECTAVSATAGTIDGGGEAGIASSLTAMNLPQLFPATAAARVLNTLDTTTMKTWGVGAAWGASSASNTITCYGLNVEVLNQGKT